MKKSRTITVDPTVGSCYIKLSQDPAAYTEAFSDVFLVDLDEYGVAVGIAILDLSAPLPLTDLYRQMHIRKDDGPYLAELLPTLKYSLRFDLRSASDPTIRARTSQPAAMTAPGRAAHGAEASLGSSRPATSSATRNTSSRSGA